MAVAVAATDAAATTVASFALICAFARLLQSGCTHSFTGRSPRMARGLAAGISLQCVCLALLCVRVRPQQSHPQDVLVSVQTLTVVPETPVVGERFLAAAHVVGLVPGVAYVAEMTLRDVGFAPEFVVFHASHRVGWNRAQGSASDQVVSVQTEVPPLLMRADCVLEVLIYDALLHGNHDEDALLGKKVTDLRVVSKPDANASSPTGGLQLLWPPPDAHLLLHPFEVRLKLVDGSESHRYEQVVFIIDHVADQWLEVDRYACRACVCESATVCARTHTHTVIYTTHMLPCSNVLNMIALIPCIAWTGCPSITRVINPTRCSLQWTCLA
jgi:hypothetical protein